MVSNVQKASASVGSGNVELTSSTQVVAQGAFEQAAFIEENSSSTELMSANISQNTDNAIKTEKIVDKAAREARRAVSP